MSQAASIKEREFTSDEKVIFELGVNEGERRMRNAARRAYHKGLTEGLKRRDRFINVLRVANHHLWEELTRMVKYEPIEGEGLLISWDLAEALVRRLKLNRPDCHYAGRLQRLINQSEHKLQDLFEEMERELARAEMQ